MTTIVIGQNGGNTTDPEAAWLLDAVDDWRVTTEKQRFDPGWFHCSQLGQSDDDLIRQYRGLLPVTVHSARELRVFDNGNSRDADWKRYLSEAGLSVVAEEDARRVVIHHLRLRGTLDDIAHDPETGQWHVIEFKTINPFSFGQLTQPKPDHLLQVTSYMAATAIHRSIVLYENKGDQSVRAFYREFDPELWGTIVQRLLRLRAIADAQDAAMDPKIVDISRRLNEELARG